MWHAFVHFMNWFCLRGDGYQFWSGFGSDFGEGAIILAVYGLFRHHVCHVDGCRKLGRHDQDVGASACKKHHTKRDKIGRDPHSPLP